MVRGWVTCKMGHDHGCETAVYDLRRWADGRAGEIVLSVSQILPQPKYSAACTFMVA